MQTISLNIFKRCYFHQLKRCQGSRERKNNLQSQMIFQISVTKRGPLLRKEWHEVTTQRPTSVGRPLSRQVNTIVFFFHFISLSSTSLLSQCTCRNTCIGILIWQMPFKQTNAFFLKYKCMHTHTHIGGGEKNHS